MKSNTAMRVIVAFIAIPFILIFDSVGGYLWFLFIATLGLLALREYFLLVESKGALPQRTVAIVASFGVQLVFIHERLQRDISAAVFPHGIAFPSQWQAFVIILLSMMIVMLLVELFRNRGSAMMNLGATMLGVLYIGLFAGAAIGVREIFSVAEFPVMKQFGSIMLDEGQRAQLDRWGSFTMAAILTSIWLCDTAAYFGGRAFGKRKLFERVSPKKTWAGAVCGFIIAVAWMYLMKALFLEYLAVPHALVIGVIVGTLGQMGDLVESLFKRDAAIKDSSELIPGHGGVFDRFDSFLFVSPVLFLYLDFIVFA